MIPRLRRHLGRLGASPPLRAVGAGAVVALAFLAVQHRLWNGKSFLGWDIVDYAWPNLVHLAGALAQRVIPLWNPYEKTGFSLIGDPEAALLYPLTWLLASLQRLWDIGPWTVLLQLLVHVAIAASGTYLYIRRLELPPPARWLGAGTYVMSARFFKSKDQTVIGAAAWFPWMLIALEELVRRPSWRSGVLLGTVVGVDVLSGYPPNVFRNLMALSVLFVFEVVHVLRGRSDWPAHLWRMCRALSAGVLVAVGLVAPLVFAVRQVFSDSKRTGLSMEEILGTKFRPGDVLQMVSPALQEAGAVPLPYIGIVPLLFVLVALTRPAGRRWVWAALALLFYLLACGKYSFVLPGLVSSFSVFDVFRIPEQNLFVFAFFCALLAARGLGDALAADADRRREIVHTLYLVGLAALGVALMSAIVAHLSSKPRVGQVELAEASVGFVVFGVMCCIGTVAADERLRRWSAWLILPLLALDVGVQLEPIHRIVQKKPNLSRDRDLERFGKGIHHARLANDLYFGYRIGARKQVREFFGRRTALTSRRYQTYSNKAFKSYNLLAAAGVRFYAGKRWRDMERQGRDGVRRIAPQLLEFEKRVPDAFWHGAPRMVKGDAEALRQLESSGPRGVAVVERGDLAPSAQQLVRALKSPLPLVPARIQRFERGALRLSVDAPARGLLVVNESYSPGWKAWVDGRSASILRVNYMFRGLLLDKGRHTIEMRFQPREVSAALVVYALTVVTLVMLMLVHLLGRWRRRRSDTVGAQPAA